MKKIRGRTYGPMQIRPSDFDVRFGLGDLSIPFVIMSLSCDLFKFEDLDVSPCNIVKTKTKRDMVACTFDVRLSC